MIIRAASLEDLPNISQLHAESWQENYQDALSSEYLANQVFVERAALWQGRLNSPLANQLVLVAEIEGTFCGFICVFGAHHDNYGTLIDNLHVKSAAKGQGIGSKLLAAAFNWAHQHYPQHNIYLEVLACNPKAIAFYQFKGGQNIASGYWHTPCGNQVEEYVYSWPIESITA
ncbi:GNAT family N-acetyltransferase [Pseudoalteromonas sp. JBTF-M23]|uniref:GNAT family N-acetyltransferase n=1 Tax=Pseudoalteromonas caenipelagi TaxID=2726988 RepID=A0A849VF42_9GAMM|nr:N-acetyltransferase [Pseudoalteromonas caenipelagi]NOU51420.1 GNAT family N-acetyltransferase [Pseudoalteromonas caenipelagi]